MLTVDLIEVYKIMRGLDRVDIQFFPKAEVFKTGGHRSTARRENFNGGLRSNLLP